MIFDNLVGSSWDDPKTLAALAAARALLGRGGTMQRITDAGLGYGGALDAQANRNTLRERANAETLLMQMRVQELQRQQAAQAEEAKRAQAVQQAYGTALVRDMPQLDLGDPEAVVPQGPVRFDQSRFIEELAKVAPAEAAKLLMPQGKPEFKVVGNSLVRIDPDNKTTPVFSEPKTAAPTELAKLIAEMNALPPNDPRRAMYQQQINKMTTHAPGVSVSYGTPIPAVNPASGKVELARPTSDGGFQFTGVEPPPQNRDVKPPAEIQRMNIAADAMDKLLNDYEALLKTNNPRDPLVQMNPTARANFQSLMKNIQLQFKDLQALGALAGPDLAIMEAAVTDPFTFKGAFYGKDGLLAQIKQARNLITVRKQAVSANTGGSLTAPAQQPVNNDPLGIRGGQ